MWSKIKSVFAILMLTAVSMVGAEQRAESWSDSIVLDMREGYCGHLVRRQAELSARAEESEGLLTVDGVHSQPLWDSTAVEDGLHTAKLQADEKEFTATLAVLNSPDVVIHEGEMTADETWTADKVHVVRHWVRIPRGRTLTIEKNAVVKFCDETGILVDGTVNGLNAFLTSVHDDSRGGDTDMNQSGPPYVNDLAYSIRGRGNINLKISLQDSSEFSMGEVDAREDFGGRLARGLVRISPLDKVPDKNASLNIDMGKAGDWTFLCPQWPSTQVADGWHDATLTEQGQTHTEALAVLNRPDVIVHGGVLTKNETWAANRLHIVKHWVRVPRGRMLTIEADAIVKFCDETGILVDGTLKAFNVYLASIQDDSLGGDTDMNGMGAPPSGEPGHEIRGDGLIDLMARQQASADFPMGELENRDGFGGRLARGLVRISSMDQRQDSQVSLTMDKTPPADWSAQTPLWQSNQVPDGWHDATLTEHGQAYTEALAVLNDERAMVHSGVLETDETWTADKLHIVKHWVRVPEERTLNIAAGAVVKICPHAGIRADGTLIAHQVIFTSTDDDTAGGDTDLDGNKAEEDCDFQVIANGHADLTDSDIRQPEGIPQDLTWTAGSVHVIHGTMRIPANRTLTLEPGAVVKLATGATLEAQPDGNIVCQGVIFTHLPDDAVGGDTNRDGKATKPEYDQYELAGFVPPESCDLRYLSLLYRGWNLFVPGADVLDTPRNRSLLRKFNTFALHDGVYRRASLPASAGTGLWMYCGNGKTHVASFDYGSMRQPSGTPLLDLSEGWNLVGVPGEDAWRVKLEGGDCVWQWTGHRYDLVKPEADGLVTLRAGRGYFIFHDLPKGQEAGN